MYWRGKSWEEMRRWQKKEKFALFIIQSLVCRGILSHKIAHNLLAVSLYVAFRSQDPDEVTAKDVLEDLQDNNIDVSQLMEWTTDHCQEAES